MELIDAKGSGTSAEFVPYPVYLGIRPNPVVRSVHERFGGVVQRLLGRELKPE